MPTPSGAAVYLEGAREGLRPDPVLTVSEWADRHRILSPRASAEPGRWRTSRTPYLRDPMDALSSSSPVSKVSLMFGAQLGKTEAGNNWLGYIVHHAPGPVMAVQPTVEMAKRMSKQRLDPLITDSPVLSERIQDRRSRDSGNTTLVKEFPGGVIVLTGANSAVGLRSMPVRYLFGDEVDAWPGDADGEGDPVRLAERGMRTFARSKELLTSTPTIAGRSRIEREFDAGDGSRFYLPCPACGEFQVLKWANMRWDEGDPSSVVYGCDSCGVAIEEASKTAMLEAGEWRAERPELSDRHRSFHLPALYSPVGWWSWEESVAMFLEAKDRPDELRVFVNTVLGETWKEKGDAPPWEKLYRRREGYPIGKVPAPVVVLTAGVDVQRDRLEVEVVGWADERESWSISYDVLPGDPGAPEVWQELERLRCRTFPRVEGDGPELPIRLMAVDSGYATQEVYTWVRRHQPDQVVAVKGRDSYPVLVGQPRPVNITRQGRTIRRGTKLWPVGVDNAKGELYGWLRLEPPLDEDQAHPPGFCHFPEYGEEYFRQLTAEHLVARIVRGSASRTNPTGAARRYIWEKHRERNEALDCRVYARAAASILGIDRWTPADWRAIMEAQAGRAPGPTRKRKRRRRRPGGYLDR